MTPTNPPRIPTWLIEQYGSGREVSNLLGDLYELHQHRVGKYGKTRANFFYWIDAMSVFTNRAISYKNESTTIHSMGLLTNYIKVAGRNLLRQKTHTAINMMGLSIGLAFSLLIYLFVAHELRYDTFHENADRIYHLPMTWHFNGTEVSTGANCSVGGPFAKEAFPEVEDYVRISMKTQSFKKGDEVIKETDVYYADSSFFKIFTFPLIEGDPAKALVEPYSIVLTRTSAEKYFGEGWASKNILGMAMEGTNGKLYKITGVTEDTPTNSHLRYNFVASFSSLPAARKLSWDNSEFYTYVLLNAHADPAKIVSEFPAKMNAMFWPKASEVVELDLVPLNDVYLRNTVYKVPNTSDVIYVKVFSVIAVLILLIATVNYINLATARSVERALEVGVRKVMGAVRAQLFYQFLSESFLLTTFSLLFAFTLARLALPGFTLLTGNVLDFGIVLESRSLMIILLASLGISLLAGIYPAVFVSNYRPVKVLKGKLKDSVLGIRIRSGLVVGQFLITITLIICTLTVSDQIHFIQSKGSGFDRDQLVSLSLDSISRLQLGPLKARLENESRTESTTATYQLPFNITHQTALSLKNETEAERKLMNAVCVESGFAKTIGLSLISGRDMTPGIESQSDTWEILLNQSAAAFLGWSPEEAVGKELRVWQTEGVVTGVVADFHFSSLHSPIAPLVIFSGKGAGNYTSLLVRTGGSPDEIRSTLEGAWKAINPDSPFVLNFLDDQYESLYDKEKLLSNIINVFAILAIFISFLGLFGLASYSIVQRTKELGIRKVLGASLNNLLVLVSGNFVRLILVAFIFAAPLSWYTMSQWLEGFAYHTAFDWMIVLLSGIAAIGLVIITIVYHTFEVVKLNPTETLRSQ